MDAVVRGQSALPARVVYGRRLQDGSRRGDGDDGAPLASAGALRDGAGARLRLRDCGRFDGTGRLRVARRRRAGRGAACADAAALDAADVAERRLRHGLGRFCRAGSADARGADGLGVRRRGAVDARRPASAAGCAAEDKLRLERFARAEDAAHEHPHVRGTAAGEARGRSGAGGEVPGDHRLGEQTSLAARGQRAGLQSPRAGAQALFAGTRPAPRGRA